MEKNENHRISVSKSRSTKIYDLASTNNPNVWSVRNKMVSYSQQLRKKVGKEVIIPMITEMQSVLTDPDTIIDSKTRLSLTGMSIRLQEFAEFLSKSRKRGKNEK